MNRNSIQHYHRMLSSIFSTAVRWQLMEDNPCSRVSPPKAEDVDIEFLDETQIAKLFEALADAPVQYSVIVQLALFTGCRRGEICGLRHTNASLLIAAHVPVVTVAGRLGHAQASTTANIYADMIQTSDAAAADALDAVFSRIKNETLQSG